MTSLSPLYSTTKIRVLAVLLSVFVLGSLTGAGLSSLYHSRQVHGFGRSGHGPNREARFELLRQDLNLSDSQASAIRSILDETRQQYHALRTEVRPRYDDLRHKERLRIRELLMPHQQQRFDQMVAQREMKHHRRELEKP